MTLWNPLNVFSASVRQPENDPSSAFDPAQTGDPLGSSHAAPAIGFGSTRVAPSVGSEDPRRRPIGFAPPEDEPRFRTELSFKRHFEAPRASAGSDQSDPDATPEWQTPGLEDSAPAGALAESRPNVEGDVAASSVEESSAHEAGDSVDIDERPEESVPFFKRELSFRRKRAVSEETDEAGQMDEKQETLGIQADADVDLPADVPVVEVATSATSVPFYKRELSFRRKSTASEESSAVVAVGEERDLRDDVTEPEVVAMAADPQQDAAVDLASSAEPMLEAEPTEEPSLSNDASAEMDNDDVPDEPDDSAESRIVEEAENVAAGAVATAATASAPVDEAELDELDLDAAPDLDAEPDFDAEADPGPSDVAEATPAEDVIPTTAAAASHEGRSSRWARRPAKKPSKRQQGRGAKGHKIVGLKIGASQIAAAVVTKTDSGPELVQLARCPLEAGIVVDGEVRDQDALAKALKAFFDDEHLPKRDVRLGLASNRIGVRTFDIVGIDDEVRFDNAVRFKAHEVLPVAVHEAVLDYRVLEQRPNEVGEQMRRVLLVVAPNDQVAPYQQVADRVGIKLSGIDLEALGLLRAFVDPKPFSARLADDNATVVVGIGHESSTLLVAGGGSCEFTRVFDWGGRALQNAIAEALEVHPAEASTILKHLSLSGPGRQYEALDDVTRAKAIEAVRLGVTPLARELVNSLQFYQTQSESLGIGGIVITGGISHLEGIDQALNAMIGVSVSVGDPLGRVRSAGTFDPAIEATIGSMAVSIGLAIDDEQARGINLLRENEAKPRSKRASMVALGVPVAAAVPFVAFGFLYFGAHGKVSDQQAQIAAVQAEIAALPQPQVPDIDASVVGEEAVRAAAVASVLGGRLAWDSVLGDLSRVLPANVWLTKLSVAQPQGGNLAAGAAAQAAAAAAVQPTTPSAVSIDGFTYSQTDVARLLARLGTLPTLRNVTLNSSQTATLGKRDVTHFVIVADLNQTGGPS